MSKEVLERLKETRKDYKAMIDFCCDGLILNNDIMPALISSGFEFDIYCGTDYDEESECYLDIFQYFIINDSDAERLSEYTNELVYYCEPLDLYILGVTHFGTPWNGVSANWKDDSDNEQKAFKPVQIHRLYIKEV